MVNVLMINYEYPPLGGGGSNATKYILENLAKVKNINIDLVTTSATNRYYSMSINSKIKIHFLPIKKDHLHYWKEREILEFLVRAFFFSKRLLSRSNYDLVHAIFGFPSGLIPFLLGNLPYIISLRGSDVPGFNLRFQAQYTLLKPLFRKIWKNAEIVTANSTGLQELAEKTLKHNNMVVIHNGVNTEEFQAKKNYRRDPLGVMKILTVSRLIKRKRIEDLLYSARMLKSQNFNIRLNIIGEGIHENYLKRLAQSYQISDCTNFLGYVPHKRLPSYYNDADVFVLPSLNEGMSNTALEAMACGLPLILTDVGGTAELITENGFITEIRKPHQIVEAIKELYNYPELNKKMGMASRVKARDFRWRNVAISYFRIYQLIHRRKARSKKD